MSIKLNKPGKANSAQAEAEMGFLDHLEELRWHILRSVGWIMIFAIVAFLAKDFVFGTLLFGPRNDWFPSYRAICGFSEFLGMGDALCMSPPEFETIATDLGELFTSHLKVSFFIGFAAAFPFVLWEVWRFIKPGLYAKEQKAARGFVSVCSFLFICGVLFGYYVISPFAITFLAGYQIQGTVSSPTISSYVSYMIMFTIPIGMVFQLPVLIYFLSKIGLVTPEFMKTYRRHAFVVILISAAIITPPDVITQFLVGFPLFFLYELSIFISARVVKKQQEEEERASKELAQRK